MNILMFLGSLLKITKTVWWQELITTKLYSLCLLVNLHTGVAP